MEKNTLDNEILTSLTFSFLKLHVNKQRHMATASKLIIQECKKSGGIKRKMAIKVRFFFLSNIRMYMYINRILLYAKNNEMTFVLFFDTHCGLVHYGNIHKTIGHYENGTYLKC